MGTLGPVRMDVERMEPDTVVEPARRGVQDGGKGEGLGTGAMKLRLGGLQGAQGPCQL